MALARPNSCCSACARKNPRRGGYGAGTYFVYSALLLGALAVVTSWESSA